MDDDTASLRSQDIDKRKTMHYINMLPVSDKIYLFFLDTPTSLSKLSRDSKESTPIASDDVKRPADAPAAERKALVKENSQESDTSLETEKRPTSVVSIRSEIHSKHYRFRITKISI